MSRYGFALLLFGFSLVARAGDYVTVSSESYRWREYQSNGSLFVYEAGQRTSLGFSRIHERGGSSSQFNMRFYFGDVFYDGGLQDIYGNTTPYQSITGYTGFSLEHKQQSFIDSGVYGEFGEGLDFWQRILDKGGAYGYTENYTALYVRAGLGAGQIGSGWHGRIGIKYPFLVYELVQAYPLDPLQLHPAPAPSFYSEVGYGYRTWGWSLFYDSYHFEPSPQVLATSGGAPYGYYLQPKSVMERMGIRFYTHY